MYQLQRGSDDLWDSVNHCENVDLQLSMVKIENGMWETIRKDTKGKLDDVVLVPLL